MVHTLKPGERESWHHGPRMEEEVREVGEADGGRSGGGVRDKGQEAVQ